MSIALEFICDYSLNVSNKSHWKVFQFQFQFHSLCLFHHRNHFVLSSFKLAYFTKFQSTTENDVYISVSLLYLFTNYIAFDTAMTLLRCCCCLSWWEHCKAVIEIDACTIEIRSQKQMSKHAKSIVNNKQQTIPIDFPLIVLKW